MTGALSTSTHSVQRRPLRARRHSTLLLAVLITLGSFTANTALADDEANVNLDVLGPTIMFEGDTRIEFAVRLQNLSDVAVDPLVRVRFSYDDLEPASLQYCTNTVHTGGTRADHANYNCDGEWLDLTIDSGVGWFGPSGGFSIDGDYDSTTLLRADFPTAGAITGDIVVVNVDDHDEEFASADVDVAINKLRLEIGGPSEVTAGSSHAVYAVRLYNTSGTATAENVRVRFEVESGPEPQSLQYCTDSSPAGGSITPSDFTCDSEWLDLPFDNGVGWFGPAGGFPVDDGYDATSLIRASFTQTGTTSLAAEAIGDPDDTAAFYGGSVTSIDINPEPPPPGPSPSPSPSPSSPAPSQEPRTAAVTATIASPQGEITIGVGTSSGDNDAIRIINVANTASDDEAVAASPPPAGTSLPFGLIGFDVTGVDVGACVDITLDLPGPAQEYWKLQDGEWYQLEEATFTDSSVTFELCDGGIGDASGVANGTIVDPGAPVLRASFTG